MKPLILLLLVVIFSSCYKNINMENAKDKLKRENNPNLQDCNFGIQQFNLTKRKLSPEELADANKPTAKIPSKGPKKPQPPPPPPPEPVTGGVVYLDFTGHFLTGTSWNTGGDVNCTPANLTSSQVDVILANTIHEFSKYNILITTDENVFNLAAIGRRMRVVITESWEWYGRAGGVAYVNSFTWTNDTPCFVFSSLLNYNTKFIKEAVSHEIGHTMGLRHQASYDDNCVLTSSYNYGNGIECPIMGVGYYTSDEGTKWWIGPTPTSCTTIQDDNLILTNLLGLK